MSTEITIYDNIQNPIEGMKELGGVIAKSRLFGCESEEQGMVLAMACMAEKKNPIEIAKKYHIIQGNLSKKADAILAEFNQAGGVHKIVEYTSDVASVELATKENSRIFTITWEDAQQESWPWKKDKKSGEKILKDNWATPLMRRNMLWARVVSEGVRRMMPAIVAGSYTPEEISDFSQEPASPSTAQQVVETVISEALQEANSRNGEVIDAEFTPKEEATPLQSKANENGTAIPTNGPATQTQIDKLQELIGELEPHDADIREKISQVHGGRLLNELTVTEADGLTVRLEQKVAEANPPF